MYVFAIMVLLGLMVLGAGKIADRYLSLAPEMWAVVLLGLGVGTAWLLSFNLFASWDILVRSPSLGLTLTGLAIGGTAWFWREILDFFGALSRKFTGEAATIEKTEHLRRVA